MSDPFMLTRAKYALENMKVSQHQDFSDVVIHDGIFKFNCSGFIGWILRESYLEAYQDFWPLSGERPFVVDYCNRIEEMPNRPSQWWKPIPNVWDIEPGDLVAWKRPLAQYDRYPSGHVMVAVNKPEASIRDGEVLLTVMDSTKQPHLDDSRETTRLTGLGWGTVGIGINEDGTPKSYFWRGAISTKEITTWVGAVRLILPD